MGYPVVHSLIKGACLGHTPPPHAQEPVYCEKLLLLEENFGKIESQMRATIAHISDIHFESLDQAVSERLTKALQDVSPNILVFTGDLVNNFWNISKGKQWLPQLCINCKIDPEKNLLVVPGNHDYRLYGTFGFRPITGLWFRHHFGAWQKKISLLPEYGISFLCFDSNPLIKGFARGQVSKHQLSQMRTALFLLSKADRDFFKASAKIALIHSSPGARAV